MISFQPLSDALSVIQEKNKVSRLLIKACKINKGRNYEFLEVSSRAKIFLNIFQVYGNDGNWQYYSQTQTNMTKIMMCI